MLALLELETIVIIDEDWMEYDRQDKISELCAGRQRTFSIVARGAAVHWIGAAKKRAGRGMSRGAFVSKCVDFYMREHPFENTRGKIAYLEEREKQLLESIAGLQKVIKQYVSESDCLEDGKQ
jgi:hypothetical protein